MPVARAVLDHIEVQTTSNYALFELLPFNRNVQKTKALEASMGKNGFDPAFPIGVVKTGAKLQIKFGHHRFVVAQKLGLPLAYVFAGTTSVLEAERATNSWKLADYLEAHVRSGLSEYTRVREYVRRTGIPLGVCIGVLGGHQDGGNLTESFKAGTFKPTGAGIKRAEEIAGVVEVTRTIVPAIAALRNYVVALNRCLFVREFDIDRYEEKLRKVGPNILQKAATVEQYEEMIESVYNARASSRLALAFLARESARARGGKKGT